VASSAPRYARAFAEVAESAGLDAAAAEQQIRDFAETLAGSGELREFLENPSIELPQKLKVLDAIAARIKMFSQVRNFIAVILEHQRLPELDEILTSYEELVDEHAGAVEARITSARPLNAEDRAQLEAQIAKLAGARPGQLRRRCHPAGRRGGGGRIDGLRRLGARPTRATEAAAGERIGYSTLSIGLSAGLR
jgi:F-type H+-transporting ATPase subunit delta